MKTWISSDIHIHHRNVLKYNAASRKSDTIEQMHERLITQWNDKVQKGDLVYILGDVSYCSKVGPVIEVLKLLNGKKILVAGNHDKEMLKHQSFRDEFQEIVDYKEVKLNHKKIVMFHFPIAQWNGKHKGSIHLHGHCHGMPSNITGRCKDIGMDTNDMNVYELEPLIEQIYKDLPLEQVQDHRKREEL